MKDCIFCKIARKEAEAFILYEDELAGTPCFDRLVPNNLITPMEKLSLERSFSASIEKTWEALTNPEELVVPIGL